ncbi:cysteine desulfurase NifS [Candidatus Aerophobetes bacterium]|uniref:Cysteine desulfurase IscS n=2 Tax=root TaxID=1 RepID=A0A523YLX4_UNCAE|nr:MAG: cysteine desulfurase NifS [Candidatus Aerophobetes bacterium]
MKRIYLDHNATTPLHPEVLEAMLPYYKEAFGNPSTIYSFGQETRKATDEARETVANLIGASPEEIIFTSGGTEADNLALKGVPAALEKKGKHIVASSIEHHAVLSTLKYLEKRGYQVSFLPVDEHGWLDPGEVEEAITSQTVLISVMHANNEVGTIEPISEIGEIAQKAGIYLHTDAVQTIGKIKVNVDDLKVDLLSLSAHKFYGPKGVGALYVRKGTRIYPLLHGGYQERRRRAGTENVAGIVGLGKAAEIAPKEMVQQSRRESNLRDRLEKMIRENINHCQLNGHPTQRLPNTLNISFEFIEGESLILNLDLKGIAASTGSACTSGSLEPSHVLMAMGVAPEIAQGSIRFSLGRDNQKEDIDYTVENLVEIVTRLREMSPLFAGRKK